MEVLFASAKQRNKRISVNIHKGTIKSVSEFPERIRISSRLICSRANHLHLIKEYSIQNPRL